jgi:hypothetical protein
MNRILREVTMYSHPWLELRRLSHAALCSVLGLTIACGGEKAGAQNQKAGPETSIRTQPLRSDPCAWVTPGEFERLVGKPQGKPRRGRTAENPAPEEDGKACVYEMTAGGPNAEGVALEVDFENSLTNETASGLISEVLSGQVSESTRAAFEKDKKTGPPDGWDYFGEGPGGTVFRMGHMAVIVAMYTPHLFTGDQQREKAIALAHLVRERIPDLPVVAEHPEWDVGGGGPDPCGLVTQQEAETVLGKLTIPPYRSKKTTPFAAPTGGACTYYRGSHRVLVLTPHWSDGRELFGLASGLTDEITSKTGAGEQSADTLEGPWDQSKADMDGTLNFLAGDRMLEVIHGTAAIDAARVMQLSRLAVTRLRVAQ